MSQCKACDIGCKLTDKDCLCTYSSMQGIDPDDYPIITLLANFKLTKLIGEDCADKLCEADNADIQTTKFKIYYNQLWESIWLKKNGSGQISKKGFKTTTSDEHEDYRIATQGEIRKKLESEQEELKEYEESWVEEFRANHPDCFECEQEQNALGCGCVNTCDCNVVSPHTSDRNSKCGGGCGSNCGCSSQSKITGNIAVL